MSPCYIAAYPEFTANVDIFLSMFKQANHTSGYINPWRCRDMEMPSALLTIWEKNRIPAQKVSDM